MMESLLQYNNWSIEQHTWDPSREAEIEQQLSFSNGYICQTAHFEEYYSGEQRLCTFIQGIEHPILNLSSLSIRLHDERLDLATWKLTQFYRCLHKNQPLLERHYTATSPKGATIQVKTKRHLLEHKEAMLIEYEITSLNYTGPISFLAMLTPNQENIDWYPLQNQIEQDHCWLWLQMYELNIQLCCAMNWEVLYNDSQLVQRPIKIEKQHTIGYSLTTSIKPGDTYLLRKKVVVKDSRTHNKEQLITDAVQCLTNL
jgi:maltose phosphorylase